MFTPTTNLRLLSVPLESDYSNTLWFPNVEVQTTYFTGKIVKTFDDFNYIKKDNTIVVAEEIDKLYNCNYIMYRNANFSTRWFYAFINRMEWASNSSTRLYVSTDVIQTWFFDITYYQSYVDRCHSDTDVAGDNIVPEDFTTGEAGGYQVAGSYDVTPDGIAVFATSTYSGESKTGSVNSGIYSGAQNLVDFHIDNPGVGTILDSYVKNGTATAVIRLQQYPYNLKSDSHSISFAKTPSDISGYTPTNKNCFLPRSLLALYQCMGKNVNSVRLSLRTLTYLLSYQLTLLVAQSVLSLKIIAVLICPLLQCLLSYLKADGPITSTKTTIICIAHPIQFMLVVRKI